MNDSNNTRERIVQIIKGIAPLIDKDELNDDMDMIGGGLLDSLDFLTLATRVQSEFGIEIPFDRYAPEEFTNFGKFVEICNDAIGEKMSGNQQTFQS